MSKIKLVEALAMIIAAVITIGLLGAFYLVLTTELPEWSKLTLWLGTFVLIALLDALRRKRGNV